MPDPMPPAPGVTDKIVGIVWGIAVSLLDRTLDSQIDRLKDSSVKDTARRIEDHVVSILAGPVGTKIATDVARTITVKALERWFENDPSTGTWG